MLSAMRTSQIKICEKNEKNNKGTKAPNRHLDAFSRQQ